MNFSNSPCVRLSPIFNKNKSKKPPPYSWVGRVYMVVPVSVQ